jgi:hypothetical protein
VPPETTVAELLVCLGAVVVVVEGAAVVDLLVEAEEATAVEDDEATVVEDDESVRADAVVVAPPPGISLATSPPITTALSAAPPAAIPVTRRTLLRAADLSLLFNLFDMTSSSESASWSRSRWTHHIVRVWQVALPPLCACCGQAS